MSDQPAEKPKRDAAWRKTMRRETEIVMAERKTGVRRRPNGIPRDPQEAAYASMELNPNPSPQAWMTDKSALPKKPPKAS